MENKNSFTVNFFVKKHRIDNDGKVPVYLRIIINKKKLEMSVYRDIEFSHWVVQSGTVDKSSKSAKELNGYLFSIKSSIYEHYKYLRETGNEITPLALKNAYLGIKDPSDKGKMIIELFREHNLKLIPLKGIDYSPETIERYETSLKHTQEYIRFKYKKDDLYINELNHEFITDYELFFKTNRKCAHNTTLKYIKNFKKIVRIAIANGYLDHDPFVNFKMRPKKVDRGFLSEDELKTIMEKEFASKRVEQVRDCFVFSCFTGLAHADLKRLNKENIVTGTDGKNWIKIKRKKTDNLSSIPILSVTQQILDKYKNDDYCKKTNVVLPVRSNQKMNEYLKEIAEICCINKNFSSHLARHTFATTVTLNNNVPIESVSKMLGHSSISMTKIYARLLDKKVGQDMEHLNDKYSISV
ncbi:MAG: site-specific integrase [Bacteroidota bacterium]